jgi:2-haloacid dehalogenase
MALPHKPDLRVLLFDAYGTLFDTSSLIPACNTVFPNHGPEVCRLWRAKQLEYTHLLTMMGRFEDFWQVTHKALVFACQSLQLECRPEQRDRLLESFFRLEAFDDAASALEALSASYPLGILSNGSPKMLKVVVEHSRLQDFFSQIISASEVGSYKPNLQVYQWACQKVGQDPAVVGLVSGNAWDVTGAKAFGLWACWVNRRRDPWEDLGFAPDATVSNLLELLPLLGLSH